MTTALGATSVRIHQWFAAQGAEYRTEQRVETADGETADAAA